MSLMWSINSQFRCDKRLSSERIQDGAQVCQALSTAPPNIRNFSSLRQSLWFNSITQLSKSICTPPRVVLGAQVVKRRHKQQELPWSPRTLLPPYRRHCPRAVCLHWISLYDTCQTWVNLSKSRPSYTGRPIWISCWKSCRRQQKTKRKTRMSTHLATCRKPVVKQMAPDRRVKDARQTPKKARPERPGGKRPVKNRNKEVREITRMMMTSFVVYARPKPRRYCVVTTVTHGTVKPVLNCRQKSSRK